MSILSLTPSSSSHRKSDAGDFSIEGLDHGLLSRGAGDSSRKKNISLHKTNGKEKKDKKRRKPKSEREKRGEGRSEGQDVWGIRAELNACTALMSLSNISAVSNTVADLCFALLLINNQGTSCGNLRSPLKAACLLQSRMDAYVALLESNPCPLAPSYPLEWLNKRNMSMIRHFQASEEIHGKLPTLLLHSQLVESGINSWRQLRKTSLSMSE